MTMKVKKIVMGVAVAIHRRKMTTKVKKIVITVIISLMMMMRVHQGNRTM